MLGVPAVDGPGQLRWRERQTALQPLVRRGTSNRNLCLTAHLLQLKFTKLSIDLIPPSTVVFRTEPNRRKTDKGRVMRMAARMKTRTKPLLRKMTGMERQMRWRSRLRVTGTSCSICPRLPPVRNTSSWLSQVKMIYTQQFFFSSLCLSTNSYTHTSFPPQPTLQQSTTAWKRSWDVTLLEQHQSRDVEAARPPSRQWENWVLFRVRCCLWSCYSY